MLAELDPEAPKGLVSSVDIPALKPALKPPPAARAAGVVWREGHSWMESTLLGFILTARGLGAFMLITLVVMVSKAGTAPRLMGPLVRREVSRAGLRLLPMVVFLSGALGFLVIGQTVSLLTKVGATEYLGMVMATAVVRELGPMLAAMLVLARVGTAHVIELGTARALGEVEALESLRIDPIHYLVAPRVAGMALGVFSLTVYFILGALLSGYLWAFVQDIPLSPVEYVSQLAQALRWMDFVLLAAKTTLFGVVIATVTCYHGLAQPLGLDGLPGATVRAMTQSVVLCVLLDALFIVVYLLT